MQRDQSAVPSAAAPPPFMHRDPAIDAARHSVAPSAAAPVAAPLPPPRAAGAATSPVAVPAASAASGGFEGRPLVAAPPASPDTTAKDSDARKARLIAICDKVPTTEAELAELREFLEDVPAGADVLIQLPTNKGKVSTCMLYTAARAGNYAVVKLLLEHDANVAFRSSEGNTPLHVASYHHHFETTALLLEYDADPTAENKKGESCAMWHSAEGRAALGQMVYPAIDRRKARQDKFRAFVHTLPQRTVDARAAKARATLQQMLQQFPPGTPELSDLGTFIRNFLAPVLGALINDIAAGLLRNVVGQQLLRRSWALCMHDAKEVVRTKNGCPEAPMPRFLPEKAEDEIAVKCLGRFCSKLPTLARDLVRRTPNLSTTDAAEIERIGSVNDTITIDSVTAACDRIAAILHRDLSVRLIDSAKRIMREHALTSEFTPEESVQQNQWEPRDGFTVRVAVNCPETLRRLAVGDFPAAGETARQFCLGTEPVAGGGTGDAESLRRQIQALQARLAVVEAGAANSVMPPNDGRDIVPLHSRRPAVARDAVPQRGGRPGHAGIPERPLPDSGDYY